MESKGDVLDSTVEVRDFEDDTITGTPRPRDAPPRPMVVSPNFEAELESHLAQQNAAQLRIELRELYAEREREIRSIERGRARARTEVRDDAQENVNNHYYI